MYMALKMLSTESAQMKLFTKNVHQSEIIEL